MTTCNSRNVGLADPYQSEIRVVDPAARTPRLDLLNKQSLRGY
jgi:hypothetical protein